MMRLLRIYRFPLVNVAAALATLFSIQSAYAQSSFFIPPGGVGNWDVADNWATDGNPGVPSGTTAFVHAGREATVDSAPPQVFGLRIADHDVGAVDGTVNILPGGVLDVADQMHLGSGGADSHGLLNQSGGTLNAAVLFLGFFGNNSAEYNFSDGVANMRDNLWFREGNATMIQTGGEMNIGQNLVLGEVGDGTLRSFYDLKGGTLNVGILANIGTAVGGGDPFNGSGKLGISGGAVATFGDVVFGDDPTDQIEVIGLGVLRIDQANYSEADALAAIAAGNIIGPGLTVGTYMDALGAPFTQITAIPEPTTIVLCVFCTIAATFRRTMGRA